MDFRFTPEHEAFRREVRDFLGQALPPTWGSKNDREQLTPEEQSFAEQFEKELSEKGWLTLAWPREYGGQGADPLQQLIYNEEMSYARAPGATTNIAIHLTGPTLMLYGTDEQRRRFLPPIARAEEHWCQGFSEPEAGSDLASLQTRAVRDGDDFVVNGTKVWISYAHRADWCILLARTDSDAPKHKGISYLFMDMKSPGIEIQPLTNILGSSAFSQIYMDNVRIPRSNLVGDLNQGWYVATTTLDFERSGIQRVMYAYRTLDEVIDYARAAGHGGTSLLDRPVIRHKLAELKLEFEVGRLLCHRVAWMQSRGLIPNYEASVSKLYGTELQQRLSQAIINMLGPGGGLSPGSPWAPLGGSIERYYLAATSYTIAAGTSEIQRNIVAMRGLGLPRG
ncbi:MAG: acyl-CoA dehydrogenase family protein [Dehalococcoidia bacterium]